MVYNPALQGSQDIQRIKKQVGYNAYLPQAGLPTLATGTAGTQAMPTTANPALDPLASKQTRPDTTQMIGRPASGTETTTAPAVGAGGAKAATTVATPGYVDPIKAQTEAFLAALNPQIQQGLTAVKSAVNPFMTGKVGASLLKDVYNPALKQVGQYQQELETAKVTAQTSGKQTQADNLKNKIMNGEATEQEKAEYNRLENEISQNTEAPIDYASGITGAGSSQAQQDTLYKKNESNIASASVPLSDPNIIDRVNWLKQGRPALAKALQEYETMSKKFAKHATATQADIDKYTKLGQAIQSIYDSSQEQEYGDKQPSAESLALLTQLGYGG